MHDDDGRRRIAQADAFLRELGAEAMSHPGGTLLGHLRRVRLRLAAWDARPALQLAGLCHAFYGTDGFPHPLLPLDRRAELVAVVGEEAEGVVYFYASCDRKAAYPGLADPGSPFRDRFTGRTRIPGPGPRLRQDLAELTAANELDLAAEDPAFRERYGPGLLDLFRSFRSLLSRHAYQDSLDVLLGPTSLPGP